MCLEAKVETECMDGDGDEGRDGECKINEETSELVRRPVAKDHSQHENSDTKE